ncbi:MAG: hypothetical protein ACI84C_000303 [Flavobacteriales bacterium]
MITEFNHRQAAHCENGVVSNLLKHEGIDLSEPMIFGIGSGLFFSYIPFVKLNGNPGTSFRIYPGYIYKRATNRLGIKTKMKTFRSADKAMTALDENLEKGIPTGIQTSVYYLPYLPTQYRFHFNAHNIVIYGKEGDEYLVSDPVMDEVTRIKRDDLVRARYAKGVLAPKGKMYYPVHVAKDFDLKPAIIRGIKHTSKDMLTIPVPMFGVKGIYKLAKDVRKWPEKVGERKAGLHLGNLVRMQEEIGTGGGGFRFIFAAFLKEAAEVLDMNELSDIADGFTKVGDRWREFAIMASKIFKKRTNNSGDYGLAADILVDCADQEKILFTRLRNLKFPE